MKKKWCLLLWVLAVAALALCVAAQGANGLVKKQHDDEDDESARAVWLWTAGLILAMSANLV